MPNAHTASVRSWSTSGTRITNRMTAALIRLGIRGFKPELRRTPKKLDRLLIPEAAPPRHGSAGDAPRADRANRTDPSCAHQTSPRDQAACDGVLLANIIGVGIETAVMFVQEALSRNLRDAVRLHAMLG
jgi:transposase